MDNNYLLVAAGKTLTCCDFEGAIQYYVQLDYEAAAITVSQTAVVCGGLNHQGTPYVEEMDLHGNKMQEIPASHQLRLLKFNESGNRLALGYCSGPVIIYKLQDAKWVRLTELEQTYDCRSLEWLKDEHICAINDEGNVSIWDSSTGTVLKRRCSSIQMHATSIYIHPDNKDVVMIGRLYGHIRKCNIRDDSFVEIQPLDMPVYTICSNDSVLVASEHSRMTAFDLTTMEELWHFNRFIKVTSIYIFESQVFVGRLNSPVIVLDAMTGEVIRQFPTTNEGEVHLAALPRDRPRFKFID